MLAEGQVEHSIWLKHECYTLSLAGRDKISLEEINCFLQDTLLGPGAIRHSSNVLLNNTPDNTKSC